jgi:hypothetical protein
MNRRDHRSVQSYLMIAMLHTIKWKTQPNKRSHSWMTSIASSRKAIADICATNPSINQAVLLSYWEQSFRKARKKATDEMRQTTDITSLSWQEVFEEEYRLPE